MTSVNKDSFLKISKGLSNLLSQMAANCGSLLYELQIIWDEIGESEAEREEILHELEQECLGVYQKKVDHANQFRAQLKQKIADAEAELAAICTAMGERPAHIRQKSEIIHSLKAVLGKKLPQLEEMRKRKCDRKNQFIEVLSEIQFIKNQTYGADVLNSNYPIIEDNDLSVKKLQELQIELKELQEEKNKRQNQVFEHLNNMYSLCMVLGLDFKKMADDIHSSLGEGECPKDVSNSTIHKLVTTIHKLREVKLQRMQQLQDLGVSLLKLWDLMDTPSEEQQMFRRVTCNIAATEDEIMEPGMLSVLFINNVKDEVCRLEELKESKMKELVLKKKAELETVCRRTHIIRDFNRIEADIDAIESGAVDATSVLETVELQISSIKEESLSRYEILDKVEKFMTAREEENWLEEYNKDDNRYNPGRGAHLILKRAEKARALVSKIPSMIDALASKTRAWEDEKGKAFLYDGVCLLSMLEEYKALRKEKELERKRQREQKKLEGQILTEQEAIYGSKPSPSKNQSGNKRPRLSCGGVNNRKLSFVANTTLQTPKPANELPHSAKATSSTCKKKRNGPTFDRLREDGNASTHCSVMRGLNMTKSPVKPHPSADARISKSPTMRKPFSLISRVDSSKYHVPNTSTNADGTMHKNFQKTEISGIPQFSTPPKISFEADEETPPPQGDVSSTASTTSLHIAADNAFDEDVEFEYSFEEQRAGFVVKISH